MKLKILVKYSCLFLLLFGVSEISSESPPDPENDPVISLLDVDQSNLQKNNHSFDLPHSDVVPSSNETKNDADKVIEGQSNEEKENKVESAPSANSSTTTTTTASTSSSNEKNAVEAEHNSSMSIFFVLCVIALGILLIHMMLQTHFQYLPESIVIVFLGALIGLILNLAQVKHFNNWEREEVFSPTAFFLVLLPPIIFESGYNLHKGNFFQNIGSILVFSIFGTTISALVIGSGVYLLGMAEVAYRLNFVESFAFGSLISAVDPVATIAIFHALDIDPVLNMLVFGESILNDAISIVLTSTVMPTNPSEKVLLNTASKGEAIVIALNRFCLMFFASAGIGVVFALMSALLLKFVDLRKHPSLEFGLVLVFIYCPYVLAEGIHLSGIMAILFCGM